VGGTLTGRGGNLILIDDPMKPEEALSETSRKAVKRWYDGTLYSRLDDKSRDRIVLIMQRLHVDDLVGHVLEQEPWNHLDLPAIAEAPQKIQIGPSQFVHRSRGDLLHPEREPKAALQAIKATLGTYHFSAQYQQSPVPLGGNLIKWRWFGRYRELPALGRNDRVIQSWDTASKAEEINDYSVCTTWQEHGSSYHLVNIFRDRLEYPDLKRRVLTEAEYHRAQIVLVEDKGSGTHLIQDLRRDGIIHPIGILPEGDKVTRMAAQTAKIEAGQVLLPAEASWLSDFQTELLQFPNGRHDDQIDSLSQFLAWVTRPRPVPLVW
jgi:predicted phage terminase large subunit-like protein